MFNKTELSERIVEKMKQKGNKQKDIVEKTGISKSAISKYMNAKQIPDVKELYKISQILGESMEWILTGESTNGNLSEDEKNVIEAYKKIDEISKKNIRKILDLPEKSKDTNTESSTSTIG